MKRSRLKFSRGSVTVLQIMVEYRKARVKLPNTKLKKKKSAASNKKNSQDEELRHELFQATRQTTKIRKAIVKFMSTDIKKNSEAQLSKMIQSGGFLHNAPCYSFS